MNIKTRAKRRDKSRVFRLSDLLKRIAAMLLSAIILRLGFTSDFMSMIEATAVSAANNPELTRFVMDVELPQAHAGGVRIIDSLGWQDILGSESAVLGAYNKVLKENMNAEPGNSGSYAVWPGTASKQESDSAVSPPDGQAGSNIASPWVIAPPVTPVPSGQTSPSALPTGQAASPVPSAPPSAPPASTPPSATPAPAPAVAGKPIVPITIAPANANGYDSAKGILVRNETSFKLDIAGSLAAAIPLSLKGDGPHVLIVHTHGSEAYTPAGKDIYTPSDYGRTEDTKFNVVRVGDEVEKTLKDMGISVVHDRKIYDYPSIQGAYNRTLEAISAQMKKTPSIKMVIDIHRDAMITAEGTVYKTVASVGKEQAAQVMLVVGTGEGGLPHKSWKNNFTVALRIQKKMNDEYPKLARPINLRRERFNQHVTNGSMLVEVGTSGNTLEEALAGARMFAKCAGEVLKEAKK